jgi:glycosyltransferase involved in cell wall biosynthesis
MICSLIASPFNALSTASVRTQAKGVRSNERWTVNMPQQDGTLRSTNGSPRVSVVIPCYNQAHFLWEAIRSVLAQTYPPFETIVIDDGSTDCTSIVAGRYPSVRCIRQPNQGLAGARNAGLGACAGDYVAFLDADDRLLPDALEVGVHELQAHPDCAFVVGQCRRVDADGRVLPLDPMPNPGCDVYAELLRQCFIWCPATVMYVRAPLQARGGFNQSVLLKGTEDYELYCRLARAFSSYCHSRMVAEYRVHAGSMSGNSALMLSSTMATLRAQRSYVRSNPRYQDALKFGIQAAPEYYGPKVFESFVLRIRTGHQLKAAVRELTLMMRFFPRGLVRLASRRAIVWFRSRGNQQENGSAHT